MKSNLIFQFLFCCLAMTTGAWAQTGSLLTTIGMPLDANNNPPSPVVPFTGTPTGTHYLVPSGINFPVRVGASVTQGSVQNAVMTVNLPVGVIPLLVSGSTTAVDGGGTYSLNTTTGIGTITWNLATVSSGSVSVQFFAMFKANTTCDGYIALFESQITAPGFSPVTSNPDLTMHAKAKNNWSLSKSANLGTNPQNIANYLAIVSNNTNATNTRIQYSISVPILAGEGDYDIYSYKFLDSLATGAIPVSLEARRGNNSSTGAWVPITVSNLSASNIVNFDISPTSYPVATTGINLVLIAGYSAGYLEYRLTVDYPNGIFNPNAINQLTNRAHFKNMVMANGCALDGGTGNVSSNAIQSNKITINIQALTILRLYLAV
jgi:hypothetical protein